MESKSTSKKYTQQQLTDLIAEKPMMAFQVFVVIMCFILNMNDGIDVMVVSYTGSEILAEWGLTKALQGYIFSAGLAGMTLGCLFVAPIADRIGRRKLFIYAVGVEALAMILSSLVTGYYQLLFLRFMAGLGIGGLLPTMAAIASEFSNNKRKDLAVGFVQAGYPIGAIFMGFFYCMGSSRIWLAIRVPGSRNNFGCNVGNGCIFYAGIDRISLAEAAQKSIGKNQ